MPLYTLQATANQSPDATLGGAAVTTPSNTGHASTTASAIGAATELKTCRWHTFPAFTSVASSVTLKITHTSSGTLSGAGVNAFDLEYTLNGGGVWNTAVSRLNFTAAQGPTVFSVALPLTQDLTQVQVRDALEASGADPGDAATSTATIASIQIEVVTQDQMIVMM